MKNLLQKSLSKSLLSKVFLLVALFFGGCSTTTEETNATPSDALIDLIGGKQGHFIIENSYYDEVEGGLVGEAELHCFYISDDATQYIEYDEYTYKYTGGSDNSATYEGTIDGYKYKLVLQNITSTGGQITLYIDGVTSITTFTWGTFDFVSSII